jgi:hypothetical protein
LPLLVLLIILYTPNKAATLFLQIKIGDAVRIRHLLTGQYLCIRSATANDTAVIRNESSVHCDLPIEPIEIESEYISDFFNPLHINLLTAIKENVSSTDFDIDNNVVQNSSDQEVFETREEKEKSKEREKIKIKQLNFFKEMKNNTSVATTAEPDYTTLFSIYSCDRIPLQNANISQAELENSGKNCISYLESIYFQHVNTSCRLELFEKEKNHANSESNRNMNEKSEKSSGVLGGRGKGDINVDNLWWEYENDIPLHPSG